MMENDWCGSSHACGLGGGTVTLIVGYRWPGVAPNMPGGTGKPIEFTPSTVGSALPNGSASYHVTPGVSIGFRWL